MNWYLDVLKKYAVFTGRARRKEYWYFVLFNLIIMLILASIDYTIGTFDAVHGYGFISSVYALFVLVPSIAVAVRRLHDIGRTGWWVLISLLPIVGTIVLLVFFVTESNLGSNEYGPNPITD